MNHIPIRREDLAHGRRHCQRWLSRRIAAERQLGASRRGRHARSRLQGAERAGGPGRRGRPGSRARAGRGAHPRARGRAQFRRHPDHQGPLPGEAGAALRPGHGDRRPDRCLRPRRRRLRAGRPGDGDACPWRLRRGGGLSDGRRRASARDHGRRDRRRVRDRLRHRLRRAVLGRPPAGGRDARGARRRRRGRPRHGRMRARARRPGDRDRARRGSPGGGARARRGGGDRHRERGPARPDQGADRGPRRRRRLRPDRRRDLPGVAAQRRLGRPDPGDRLRERRDPADPGEHPAGQERRRRRLLLGQLPAARPGARAERRSRSCCAGTREGRITPLVSEVRPLAEAPQALERLLSRKSSGKIVLTIDDRS